MTGFSLLGGDFFERENAFAEQMTVWRDPDAKEQKTGQVTFVPSRHDPAKQFWREFPSVFCEEGRVSAGLALSAGWKCFKMTRTARWNASG